MNCRLERTGGSIPGSMQTFSGISRLLLALLLQLLLPAQMSYLPEIAPTKVMGFEEMLVRTLCQPMEQSVRVEEGFAVEMEYIYKPACVPLRRCAESFECIPTLERNITLPIMRGYTLPNEPVQVTFVEHQNCECRPRQNLHINESEAASEEVTQKDKKQL